MRFAPARRMRHGVPDRKSVRGIRGYHHMKDTTRWADRRMGRLRGAVLAALWGCRSVVDSGRRVRLFRPEAMAIIDA